MARLLDTLKHGWNAFTSPEETPRRRFGDLGQDPGYSSLPGSRSGRFSRVMIDRSITTSIYTRISVDASGIPIRHVKVDKETERYLEEVQSGISDCLNVEANIDQGGRAFRQDIVQTMIEEGHVAVVPIRTDLNPLQTGGYDIRDMRVGTVTHWWSRSVRVRVWNEDRGFHEEITLPKSMVAIAYNPLYSVMNEPNSTLQRLMRKLGQLDSVDEQSASGKLDLIIQLPYTIKTNSKRQQAEQRRKDIEFQLKDSKYGIAYTDGTEKITQLNRPAENNLMKQVEYLTTMLYGQLGLTEEIMNGTADEATMLNYYNRTIEPILDAITEAMARTFLTKTARSQGQRLMYFRDPFKLVPLSSIAEIADKFTRNEIFSSNEVRQYIGVKPSKDKKADELRNSNMPAPPEIVQGEVVEDDGVDAILDEMDSIIDQAFVDIGEEP